MTAISTAVETRFLQDRIPPPSGVRDPMRVNAYDRGAAAACQLLPLFPYLGPGAMVPCVASFTGTPGLDFGHFFHQNSEDELVLCYGGNKGMLATGQVFATQPLHGVNSFLRNGEDPEAFLVLTITQRQTYGEQKEAVLVRCKKCHAELAKHEFDSTPPADSGDITSLVTEFTTIVESQTAADLLKGVETCPNCGAPATVMPPDVWGSRFVKQVRTAKKALLELDRHGRELHENAAH